MLLFYGVEAAIHYVYLEITLAIINYSYFTEKCTELVKDKRWLKLSNEKYTPCIRFSFHMYL